MLRNKLRVCSYIRVSTNNIKQKSSLEYQKLSIRQYIKEHDYNLVLEYEDVGSGLNEKRKNFKLMIEALKNNEFDILIVKSVCRLSRNTHIAANLKNLLQIHGVSLITIDKGINTLTNPKSINELISMTQSYENESLSTSNRIRDTKLAKAKDGKFNGSIAPYGYHLSNGKLIVNNDERRLVVKRIFSEFISGKTYAKISRMLEDENIKPPSYSSKCSQNISLNWGYSTIRGILTNEVYCGNLVQNKSTLNYITDTERNYIESKNYIRVKNTHEAIISQEDFEIVQSKINNKKASPPRNSNHLYADILFCGDCGSKMHIRKNSRGKIYYLCGSYNKKKKDIKCTSHKIFKDELSSFILEDVKLMINSADFTTIFDNINSYTYNYFTSLKYKSDLIIPKIEALEIKKFKAFNDKCDGSLCLNDYKNYVEQFDKQILDLKIQYTKSNIILKNKSHHLDNLNHLLNKEKDNFLSIDELTAELLNRLIKKIEIFNDETLNIHYNFNI